MVACLRQASLEDLVTASTNIWNDTASALVQYVWVPVTDDQIVMDVTSAEAFQGPLLTGLVNNEGGLLEKVGVSDFFFFNLRTLVYSLDGKKIS